MKYYAYITCFLLFSFLSSSFSQTQTDSVAFYQLKDALWNQTATTAKDSGTPGDKNGTISGNGIKFVNNGGGGTAIEYSITSNDAKISGITADWGEKFVLEARLKKSALEQGGTNSDIYIIKNAATTGLSWFVNTQGKMVLKVGDGSAINIISQNSVLSDDAWTTLAVAVDLTKSDIADAVKFFRNGSSVQAGNDPLNKVIFDQQFTARDFNANPLVIDNLQGDTYDYTLVISSGSESGNARYEIVFNNDTGANYRNYWMRGHNSTPSASISDSSTYMPINAQSSSSSSLAIAQITGSSNGERLLSAINSAQETSASAIYKYSHYWKNTTDELSSLLIRKNISISSNTHIRIYQTPKASSTDNWELVDTLIWNNELTEKSFTGLDGNTAKEYKILWEGNQTLLLKINNDTSPSYDRQRLYNNGNISTNTTVGNTSINIRDFGKVLIKSQSGNKRLIYTSASRYISAQQDEKAWWWNNTTDNIVSLDCSLGANTIGTAKLYKKKHPNGVADKFNLPFEVVEVVDINGDFSAGHTFTNLTGDSEFMYKIEFFGTRSSALRMRFNNDSTSLYHSQILSGQSSTVSASGGASNNYLTFVNNVTANKVTFSEMYLYPKSGQKRSGLIKDSGGENAIGIWSNWWPNTTDELTSISVFSNNSNTVTGKLILSKIPLDYTSQQSQTQEQPVAGSAEKVFEFEGNRDLNTNPIVISGLEGDKYDYSIITKFKSSVSTTSGIKMIANGELSKYDYRYTGGMGSTPRSFISTPPYWAAIGWSNGMPGNSFSIVEITGKSDSKMLIRQSLAYNKSATEKGYLSYDNYWNNNSQELTSLKIYSDEIGDKSFHIKVFKTPKEGDQGNWEFVESLTWDNAGGTKVFTGLDGDTDEKYKIVWDGATNATLQINGDASNSYIRQYLRNNNGTIQVGNAVSQTSISLGDGTQGFFIIDAKTGQDRLCHTRSSNKDFSLANLQSYRAHWYKNSTSNITTLSLATSGTGVAKLYRLKDKTKSGEILNWETIETVNINGDFITGHVFDSLSGNSEDLYKIEFIGKNSTTSNVTLKLQINNDTGNNYDRQYIFSNSDSVTSVGSSNTYIRLSHVNAQATSSGFMYIYPKSGNKRIGYIKKNYQENRILQEGLWWNNTTDEITSIKVFASSSEALTGTLRLSRLVDSVTEPIPQTSGQIVLDQSSTYSSGIYPTISGENAVEMLSKTGDFSLQADFLKMTLKRTSGDFDAANIQIGEGYKVDADYNVLTATSSKIFVYPPKLLRRIYNKPADFDSLGRPKNGITVDVATSPTVSKVYYGMFQFEFALDKVLSENVTVDVYMKTADFDFKKIAEVKPTAKPADPDSPWIIKYYWNSRVNQFDWDGNAYKTSGAVEFKFEIR